MRGRICKAAYRCPWFYACAARWRLRRSIHHPRVPIMSVRNFSGVLATIAALAANACSCTSDGLELKSEHGSERTGATFHWENSDDVSGTITTTLTDGRVFSGSYYAITSETDAGRLAFLWDGWSTHSGWRDWHPGPRFVEKYNGKVLANLTTDNGDRMRCQFTLAHPASGMNSGGEGICQLDDGTKVNAAFPPARPVKHQSAVANADLQALGCRACRGRACS